MSYSSNFGATGRLSGTTVEIAGESTPDTGAQTVCRGAVLRQGDLTIVGVVSELQKGWTAVFEGAFKPGEALAMGIEAYTVTDLPNPSLLTFSWTQTVPIEP